MKKIILLNHVQTDGVGDFSHFLDIYDELRHNNKYGDTEFIPLVCCKRELIPEVEKRLRDMGLLHYYVGTLDDYKNKYCHDVSLKQSLSEAEQLIQISYCGEFISPDIYNVNPLALLKYVGEHEIANGDSNPFSRFKQTNVMLRSMGLSPNHYGIKIKKVPVLADEDIFASIEMNDVENDFVKKLLLHTGAERLCDIKHKNILIPAYFNREYSLSRFLLLMAINKKLSLESKDIAVYLSGIKLDHISKLSFKINEFVSSDIKQIEFIGPGDSAPLVRDINPNGKRTIRIFYGFYLRDDFYNALYRQTLLAAVSGDNTFEKAISYATLPYYHSTNCVMKRSSLQALADIIRENDIGLTDEIKKDFIIYFEQFHKFAGIYGEPRDILSTEYVELFSNLNLVDMSKQWPIVSSYLLAHHNFYSKLEDIIFERTKTKFYKSNTERIPLPSENELNNQIKGLHITAKKRAKDLEGLKFLLERYIARIESYIGDETNPINYRCHFNLFKAKQAANREANYYLARELRSELDRVQPNDYHKIRSLFTKENILRQRSCGYSYFLFGNAVRSKELNQIINDGAMICTP